MAERIVIGSNNPAKIGEWRSWLKEFGVDTLGLRDFSMIPEPEETGETFVKNAEIKASWYAVHTQSFVLADDGGYEIDFLGGWPGVKSRRILPGGKEGTDEQITRIVLEKMKGVPTQKRTVRLTSSLAFSDPTGRIIFEDIASSSGIIAEKSGPVLVKGYPFRSIHFLPEYQKTYAELTPEELLKHSHKLPMAKKLVKFLKVKKII